MQLKLNEYFYPLLNFMSSVLGENSEIVVYDVDKMEIEYILNPFNEQMKIGSSMRSFEKNMLEKKVYEQQDFIVNYRALSISNKKLKSGSFFLKDKNGTPIKIITINTDVDLMVDFRDLLNNMVSGHIKPSDETVYDQFDVSVEGYVQNAINSELSHYNVETKRLSPEEKLAIVQSLDSKGLFLIKGAISELAETLSTTETTIYRYLSKK